MKGSARRASSVGRAAGGGRSRARDLADLQSAPDHRRLPIDRVGVKDLRYPFQVRDARGRVQGTVAVVSLAVDLPHHFKGAHLSRFVEALGAHGPVLRAGRLRALCEDLLARLKAERAYARFSFPYFVRKRAPATGAEGLMDYAVEFEAALGPDGYDLVVTVIVPVATLCPCSRAISERGAHNQRARVTFSVRSRRAPRIEGLIAMVEASASAQLYSLLKRPDEKAVTEAAYDNPVFVEDLVRNVAERAAADPSIAWYRVEAESHESIHNHDACALIESR